MRIILLLLLLFPNLVLATDALIQQAYPCTPENAARNIAIDKGSLLICYFGSEPIEKLDGWIHVVGVSFHRLVPKRTNPEFLAQSDEFGFGVDYKIVKGKLEIVSYSDTYPDFKATQFYVETIDFSKVPASHQRHLVYIPAQVSKEEITRGVSFLKIGEAKYKKVHQQKYGPGLLYEHLFKLRDYAFVDPISVVSDLKKMEHYWWNDGEVAEVFGNIQRDVEMILEINKESK
jgi:hypothetical protein